MARMATVIAALVLGTLLAQQGAAIAADRAHDWKTYRNQRFGFQLQYPKDLFKPGEPPTNGAGLDFLAKDGAEILAQASFNVDTDVTPQSYRQELGAAGNVSKDEGEGNWFVVVRNEQGTIWYDKVIFTCSNQLLNQLTFSYPADKSELYDPILRQVGESFRPGKGEDGPGDCLDPTR
jgi:hypothetical protein